MMPLALREACWAAVFAAGYLAVFLLAGAVHRRFPQRAELSRKTAHLASCLIALGLPFALSSVWTVAATAALFTAALLLMSRTGALKCIFGVSRRSAGVYLIPAAVFLVFLTARHDRTAYVTALLVLGFADTAACLVGRLDPKRIVHGKSVAGSVSFFLVAFLCILLVRADWTGRGMASVVLVALALAALLAVVELASFWGFDNLTVPLAAVAGSRIFGGASHVESVCFAAAVLLCSVLAFGWLSAYGLRRAS